MESCTDIAQKDRASEVSVANGDATSQVSRKSAKDRAREAAGKTKEYLSEKVPQARRDQAIWRLKKMVMEIQGHADCESHSSSFIGYPRC